MVSAAIVSCLTNISKITDKWPPFHVLSTPLSFLPAFIIPSIMSTSIMSTTNQPISIGTEDPEYYTELLMKTSRLANQHLPSDEQSCPSLPIIQNINGPPTQHLQTLLDVVADISLCQQRNKSATMASLKNAKGTLEIQLYVAFNHENDEAASSCHQHLESIFGMLQKVPYRPSSMDGSSKDIALEFEDKSIEICRAIHNHSFEIFAHRVTKHRNKLSNILGYIKQDLTHITLQNRSILVDFLQMVDGIIKVIDKVQVEKQLSTADIQSFQTIYAYWTKHDLLHKDMLADNCLTLLDYADIYLGYSA